ncbi:hypothetical protein GCM10027515_33530 [Schumannella luteola]|uniref:DNA-directed RNA polymerase specialized sigma24 family protein n=1 Tax=Schumannella luteola TaxID=472059 RepID=A0A852YG39_9MICO|nr:sigma-70 family RNA polymerase sigma factor [Schumannella luteola]NYH00713.1 DNA-directed RNA polymerase specialized sigma24 family protein [Schumannella luteola]TPX03930.1 sigma-70 family RNA polymerase sigma factor [Schumannella luteola]
MPAFTTLDFDEFLDADFGRAVSAVGVITGDTGLARQAVEDVLVGLVQRPPARVIENRIAWVVVVASERAEKLARERRRAARGAETADDLSDAHAEGEADAGQPVGESASADPALVIQSQMLQRMRGLPLRARQVGVLSYQLGLSIERIGEGLGVPAPVVSQELQRMRSAVFPPRVATSAPASASASASASPSASAAPSSARGHREAAA